MRTKKRETTFCWLFFASSLTLFACETSMQDDNKENNMAGDNNVAEFELFLPLTKNAKNSLSSEKAMAFVPLPADSYNGTTSTQSERIDKIRKRQTTASVLLTRINMQAFKENDFLVSLPSRKASRFSRKYFEAKDDNNFTWSGEISGTFSTSTFVIRNGNATGSIQNEDNQLYSVEPIGDGIHALVHIDESALLPCAPPLLANSKDIQNNALSQLPEMSADPTIENPAQIDVLVAYTPLARDTLSNVETSIELAVAETNQTYRNSGIYIQMNLVGTMVVNYSESDKNYSTVLDDFTDMPEVHARRDALGADVVILIVGSLEGVCGVAWLGPSYSLAFGVVKSSCITGNYTFAHEIGHMQGAQHNEQAKRNISWPYGHGFIHPSTIPSQNFRTVMAYDCTNWGYGFCPRISYWSNPDINHNDIAMGTTQTNNNVRLLNETAETVAAFKSIISYNANGGAGAPPPQTKTYNIPLTLSIIQPSWNKHAFMGWDTSPTAMRASYQPGDSYTDNAPATLYAVWRGILPSIVWETYPSEDSATEVSFEFGSDDATAWFECSLNAEPFARCTSPHVLQNLALGPQTFAVRAVNEAGESATLTHSWSVLKAETGCTNSNNCAANEVCVSNTCRLPDDHCTPTCNPPEVCIADSCEMISNSERGLEAEQGEKSTHRESLPRLLGGCSSASGTPLVMLALVFGALAYRRKM